MLEQFKSYFVKLRRLSSAELDRSAEKLVRAENGNIAKLIAHIAEMSARKVALAARANAAEELATHSPAGQIRRVQFQILGRSRLQGQVRETRRSSRCRECSKTHGGNSRESPRHRPREKRPEREARAAEEVRKFIESKISFKRDREKRRTGQVPLHLFRSFGAGARTCQLSMRISCR